MQQVSMTGSNLGSYAVNGGSTNTSRTNASSNVLQSSQGASNVNNFKVVVRLRPPLAREK